MKQRRRMKIIDMSRRECRFWSMNILASLMMVLAFYAIGHSEQLLSGISGNVSGAAGTFSLSWLLVFAAGYLSRGSWRSLKQGFAGAFAAILVIECVKLFAFETVVKVGGLLIALLACAVAAVVITAHEKVLV